MRRVLKKSTKEKSPSLSSRPLGPWVSIWAQFLFYEENHCPCTYLRCQHRIIQWLS
jgi:hypothetical protein